jgi:pyruvate kinase
MIRQHRTKIVATLGPASSTPETIEALFKAGVDMFRLNFSHGDHDDHRQRYETVRELEKRVGRPIAVLADLQGPKLRVGVFADGSAELAPRQAFRLDLDESPGDARRVALPHREIFQALRKGSELLLDDGRIRLRVSKCGKDFADTKVVTGGTLSDRKGVNVPGVVLPLSPITKKDRSDLKFALKLGVDWVALSFIQRPEDIAEARKLIGGRAAVMAKLEKPAALEHLDEIVAQCDGIMVARGDLGVEIPPEEVPVIQKRILRACRQLGRPVVVATQMLESMVHAPTPSCSRPRPRRVTTPWRPPRSWAGSWAASSWIPCTGKFRKPNGWSPRRPRPMRSAPPRARWPTRCRRAASSPIRHRARQRCASRASGRTCRSWA